MLAPLPKFPKSSPVPTQEETGPYLCHVRSLHVPPRRGVLTEQVTFIFSTEAIILFFYPLIEHAQYPKHMYVHYYTLSLTEPVTFYFLILKEHFLSVSNLFRSRGNQEWLCVLSPTCGESSRQASPILVRFWPRPLPPALRAMVTAVLGCWLSNQMHLFEV